MKPVTKLVLGGTALSTVFLAIGRYVFPKQKTVKKVEAPTTTEGTKVS